MEEEWKEIPNTDEKYIVSNYGRVASCHSLKRAHLERRSDVPYGYYLISLRKNKYGYMQVYITIDGKRKPKYVHRLVMETFVGKSELDVNHINEDKTDNRLLNLEYLSRKENSRYSFEKPIERYDLETGKVRAIYASFVAAREDGYNISDIGKACTGEFQSYKGYGWRYHDEFR